MIRKICWGLVAAIALMIVLELVLPMGLSDTKPWWHHTTGFFAVFGVVACVALVYVAKFLGKLGLQQPEPTDAEVRDAPLDVADPPRAPLSSTEEGAA